MRVISAQVSLYPLRQTSIGPPVRGFLRVLQERGLEPRMGEMSTLISGEEDVVFEALREAFHQAAQQGDMVMTVTLSNACPAPSPGRAERHGQS